MVDGFYKLNYRRRRVGYLALQDPETLKPVEYYSKFPRRYNAKRNDNS